MFCEKGEWIKKKDVLRPDFEFMLAAMVIAINAEKKIWNSDSKRLLQGLVHKTINFRIKNWKKSPMAKQMNISEIFQK